MRGLHLVVGTLVCLGAAAELPEVPYLTAQEFDETTGEGYHFVAFTAPWCGHCKRLKGPFAEAAGELDGLVQFAHIDATQETELKDRFEVTGYPTIKFIANGEMRDYKGGRSAPELAAYARRMSGPLLRRLGGQGEVDMMVASSEVAFLLVGEEDTPLGAALIAAAEAWQGELDFGVVDAEDTTLSTVTPAVAKMERGEEPRWYSGAAKSEELGEWIQAQQFPVIALLGPGNFKKYMESGRMVAVGVVDPEDSQASDNYQKWLMNLARPGGSDLSTEARESFHFTLLNGKQWAQYVARFGIEGGDLPQLLVMPGIAGAEGTFYLDKTVTEPEEMETWLQEVADGTVGARREVQTSAVDIVAQLWKAVTEDYFPYSLGAVPLAVFVVYALLSTVVDMFCGSSRDGEDEKKND